MRHTRFMSWFFLALSLAFFFVRDFRYALEAPLANYVYTRWFAAILNGTPGPPPRLEKLYTVERYVSYPQLIRLADQAAQRGDAKSVAFAALSLPAKGFGKEALRLADQAVESNSDWTWIYVPLSYQLDLSDPAMKRDLRVRLDRAVVTDSDNAFPHIVRACMICGEVCTSYPKGGPADPMFLNTLTQQTEWRKEMATAFASPRYDSYFARYFNLLREVTRGRGWDNPAVVVGVFDRQSGFSFPWIWNYANLLVLKLGAEAEAQGRLEEALKDYWQVAQFGGLMRLQGPMFIERYIGLICQRIAFKPLAPALRKAGRKQEADEITYVDQQTLADMRRFGFAVTHDKTSNDNWSVLLVNLFAGLVAVFAPLALLVISYVNAKLWIRKEKKGRLYALMTSAENYVPIVLFLSCLALYLAYAPFGQNFAHYMTSNEQLSDLEPYFSRSSYPLWDIHPFGGGLPLRDPFGNYWPKAVVGVAVVVLVFLIMRWRTRSAAKAAPR